MVSVAQWLEHWTVAPGVGGSSPLTHPNQFCDAKLEFTVKELKVESLDQSFHFLY